MLGYAQTLKQICIPKLQYNIHIYTENKKKRGNLKSLSLIIYCTWPNSLQYIHHLDQEGWEFCLTYRLWKSKIMKFYFLPFSQNAANCDNFHWRWFHFQGISNVRAFLFTKSNTSCSKISHNTLTHVHLNLSI